MIDATSVAQARRVGAQAVPASKGPAPTHPFVLGARARQRTELAARLRDTPGWKLSESAHYAFVVTTDDAAFTIGLREHAEAARTAVRELFPHPELDPVPIHQGVAVVRCARDALQYYSYSGPSGSAGYWSSSAGELALYRDQKGGDAFTWRELQPLVFHAYMHELYGSHALPPWFSFGHAEWFRGYQRAAVPPELLAVPDPTRRIVLEPGVNAQWIETWKTLDQRGSLTPLGELLAETRAEIVYSPEFVAEAWALVQHLRTLEREHPDHSNARILSRWFELWKEDGDAARATRIAFEGVDQRFLMLAVRASVE